MYPYTLAVYTGVKNAPVNMGHIYWPYLRVVRIGFSLLLWCTCVLRDRVILSCNGEINLIYYITQDALTNEQEVIHNFRNSNTQVFRFLLGYKLIKKYSFLLVHFVDRSRDRWSANDRAPTQRGVWRT